MRCGVAEMLLIVDDEDSVRLTFQEWLQSEWTDVEVIVASDAASALRLANDRVIDLAILDWNLGAGHNGLQLLEDLHVFQPDLVAILVTGYANQATPLEALRMGVRDYLDKNSELTRTTFIAAVRKQLERLRPLKMQRQLQARLQRFQEAIEQAIPYVRVATHRPLIQSKEEMIHSLLEHLCDVTGAVDGCLVLRQFTQAHEPHEPIQFWTLSGSSVPWSIPFGQSLAATLATRQSEVVTLNMDPLRQDASLHWTEQELKYTHVLGTACDLGLQSLAVVELFCDTKQGSSAEGFTAQTQARLRGFLPILQAMLHDWLVAEASQQLLFKALEQALAVSQSILPLGADEQRRALRNQIVASISDSPFQDRATEELVQLTDRVQSLAQKHGPATLTFCLKMLHELDAFLSAWPGQGMEAATS